jgi:hypothetical protein
MQSDIGVEFRSEMFHMPGLNKSLVASSRPHGQAVAGAEDSNIEASTDRRLTRSNCPGRRGPPALGLEPRPGSYTRLGRE